MQARSMQEASKKEVRSRQEASKKQARSRQEADLKKAKKQARKHTRSKRQRHLNTWKISHRLAPNPLKIA